MAIEELAARMNVYSEVLLEIPTSDLSRVFLVTRKRAKSFPKPWLILETWKDIEFDDVPRAERKPEVLSASELPTQEQHEAAIRVIGMVVTGRIPFDTPEEKQEAHNYLQGIFTGELETETVLEAKA